MNDLNQRRQTLRWACAIVIGFTLIFLSCGRSREPSTLFPDTGKAASFQRVLDLNSHLRIMGIAIEPGFEDFATLAYLRLGRGAKIRCVYTTNGDFGENDVRTEFPQYTADRRRREASDVMSRLDGECYFLNMAPCVAGRDTAYIRRVWPADSLRMRLATVLSQFQPDVILVFRGIDSVKQDPRLDIIEADLLWAVEKLKRDRERTDRPGTDGTRSWNIHRIFMEVMEKGEFGFPVGARHRMWGRSYRDIGDWISTSYASTAAQRASLPEVDRRYHLIYGDRDPENPFPDWELHFPLPESFYSVEQRIESLTAGARHGATKRNIESLCALMDTVHVHMRQAYLYDDRERRLLFDWKNALEVLRSTWKGISVMYTIEDTVMTSRQLNYFTIDRVIGLEEGVKAAVYFTGLEGWAVNEQSKNRFPLKVGQSYRLLSPTEIELTIPPGQSSLQTASVGKSIGFYVVHHEGATEDHFVYGKRFDIDMGPFQTVEILTPIVRMEAGEHLVVRITNLTKEVVKDYVLADNEWATIESHLFELQGKHDFVQDTLEIVWKKFPDEGTVMVPLLIGNTEVGRFAARHFHAEVDTSRRVGLLAGLEGSPTANAIRNLGVDLRSVEPGEDLRDVLSGLDVAIIDGCALTVKPELTLYRDTLDHFVRQGGHLIVLNQNAYVWNKHPLWDGIRLYPTVLLDKDMELDLKNVHRLLLSPNQISEADFKGWLKRLAPHSIRGTEESVIRVQSEGDALLMSKREGGGLITYVALDLVPQLMNYHPGAFRLLANLISLTY